MNNAPLPASLWHILEVGNTIFVIVSRVAVCCCWAITSRNHLFPLPFLVYFCFQRMGLWSRTVDWKVFSKPPTALKVLGLADVPFPHFLCLRYWYLQNARCRCSGGSLGPFSDPSAVAVVVRGLYTGLAFLWWASIKRSRWSEVLIDLLLLKVTEDVRSIALPTDPGRWPGLSFRLLSLRGMERQGGSRVLANTDIPDRKKVPLIWDNDLDFCEKGKLLFLGFVLLKNS